MPSPEAVPISYLGRFRGSGVLQVATAACRRCGDYYWQEFRLPVDGAVMAGMLRTGQHGVVSGQIHMPCSCGRGRAA